MNVAIGWKQIAVLLIALALCVVGWVQSPEAFFVGYLAAVMLPWSISIGSLTFMIIYSLTGGKWAEAAWPWLTMNARLMPLVAVLFVPVLVGAAEIYPWANSDVLQQFENTANRQWYFQLPFFIGRSVFYFVIWCGLSWLVTRSGTRQEFRHTPDWSTDLATSATKLNQGVAGLSLIAILLTVTWAGMDWVMSFDPFFASTLFGALIGIGAMLAGMSAAVGGVSFQLACSGDRNLDAYPTDKARGDLSSLLLAFLMLWAYFSFAHFLIMWSGDLPIEAAFYVARNEGLWKYVTPVMSLFGFVIPFLCLLSYDFKRTPKLVGSLAIALLVVRQIELCWMVLPVTSGSEFSGMHWGLLPTIVLLSGLYLAGLAWQMQTHVPAANEETRHVE